MADAPEMSFADIVTQVQNQARSFRAVLALADALDDVNKMDQLHGEANVRLTAAREQEAEMQEKLAALGKSIDDAQKDVAKAKAKADDIVSEAMRQAGTIKRKAADDAEKVYAEAREGAQKMLGDAQKALDQINARTSEAEKTAAAAEAEAKAKTDELAGVNAQLEEARKAIAALLKV